ncbi:MAG: hypothetical protein NTW66_00275 [Candidatus Magasanikbacteria bacterium]|nr:hypothetical protein [Candidatus Magasanikbacteria bacterium]
MANPAPQDTIDSNARSPYDDEPTDLERRATELQRRRAIEKRAKKEPDYLAKQDVGPATEFAGMEHPEIGELPEKPTEEEQAEEGEEGAEERGGREGEEGGEEEGSEEEQAMMAQEQMAGGLEQRARAGQPKINELRTASLKINRQMQGLQKEVEKGLSPINKQIFISKATDRTKNAVKWIRICAGGFALWYTIVLPLLSILGIMTIGLLWLAGISMGAPSLKTQSLENKLKTLRKTLEKQRDQRARPLRQQLLRINRQINQLSNLGAKTSFKY